MVRIATHSSTLKMGYGSRALELLSKFYEGKLVDLVNEETELENYNFKEENV